MRKSIRFHVIALFLCGVAMAVAYHQPRPETMMIETAKTFLDSLTQEQKAGTVFEFSNPERMKWHYFPERGFRQEYGHDRHGITFKKMDPRQRHLAYALLSASLSQMGFVKAIGVMGLEEVVRVFENDTTGHRDAENYHFSIFGLPSLSGTWGWRVEGHHLALNFSMKNGTLVSSSPTFFGANPHEVPQGPQKGMRVLSKEEDLARALLRSMDSKQRRQAIFLDIAPDDIVTLATVRAKLEGQPQGLPASRMTAKQVDMLMDLLEVYAGSMPPPIAATRMKTAKDTPREKLFFAWAGDIERLPPKELVIGKPTTGNRAEKGNYYRVQGPSFLVEYDNTQNQSNHSHSVWRDFSGDFGLDLLAFHRRTFHASQYAQNRPIEVAVSPAPSN